MSFSWRALSLSSWLLIGCTPVFVQPVRRAYTSGGDLGSASPSGYLQISVDSNLDAMRGRRYQSIADGYRYLAVTSTVSVPGYGTPAEYPLLLIDLDNGQAHVASGVSITRGQYVELLGQRPMLTLTVTAIPRTIASAFVETWDAIQRIGGILPIGELLGSNPYLALAGQVLDGFANAASSGDSRARLDEDLGIGSPSLPLDDTPMVFFLVRTDDATWTAPASLVQCAGPPGALCLPGSPATERYAETPFLVVRASVTDYRPPMDWGEFQWNCEQASEEQVASIESRFATARLTGPQRDAERAMLDTLRVLREARRVDSPFPLDTEANIARFADLAYQLGTVEAPETPLWTTYYDEDFRSLQRCVEHSLIRHGDFHRGFFHMLMAAFAAGDRFDQINIQGPISEEMRENLEGILREVRAPIDLLRGLQSGTTYAMLLARASQVERMLLPSYRALADRLQSSPLEDRSSDRSEAQARLLTSCQSCRTTLQAALLQDAQAQAAPTRERLMAAQAEVERVRHLLTEERVRAAQMLTVLQDGLARQTLSQRLEETEAAAAHAGTVRELREAVDRVHNALEDGRGEAALPP